MNILRKIIIKEWFRYLIYSFLTLFLLVSIATLITGLLRSNVTTLDVFISYFIDVPFQVERILPVSCLIASLFSVNKLKETNELTAIFATGFSQNNYIRTIFSCASIVALSLFLLGGFIKPYFVSKKDVFLQTKKEKFNSLKTKGLRASTLASGKIWYKSGNYFLSFAAFDSKKKQLKDVSLFYFDGTSKIERAIFAETLTYHKGNSWVLNDGFNFSSLNNSEYPAMSPVLNMYTYLEEIPEDLMQIESDITTLNFFQLEDYVSKLDRSGIDTSTFKMTLYEKFSGPIMAIVFAVFALYPIFNPSRRQSSFAKNSFFIFVLTIAYWFINSYFLELGNNAKIMPFVASFAIPLILGLYTSFFVRKNQQLA